MPMKQIASCHVAADGRMSFCFWWDRVWLILLLFSDKLRTSQWIIRLEKKDLSSKWERK